MCQINCSGGCPECSPEDHQAECKEKFASSLDCTCVEDVEVVELVEHTCEEYRYCEACQIEKRQKSYPHINTLKGIHVPSQQDVMAIAAENRASFRSFIARR